MPSLLPRFLEITAADLRAIKRLTSHLIEATDLDTLGRELIAGSKAILSADCMLWNLWTPTMDELLGCEANHHHYSDELEKRGSALNATIHHHPVIAAGRLDCGEISPQRMSDFQSYVVFKSNPLFHEVYRHVESHHQIAYIAAKLADSQIILSWNLKSRDFTDREVQLLHLIGLQVGMISRRIEERWHLRAVWESLAQGMGAVMDSETATDSMLGPNDGRILSGVIRGEARMEIAAALRWRRDTLDRHLGGLRERLGYENTGQLMQSLAELRPSQGHASGG